MDSELLSLKWNNHKNTFLGLIKLLRNKASYCDVTLACEGKFYQVHKIVLSVCSDYFAEIFEHTSCKNPVIVLKDINYSTLEFLLDYMYLGEVNVKQSELSVLIKAAECLQIKGLAAPDEHANNSEWSKNKFSNGDERAPKRRKKRHLARPCSTELSSQSIESISVDDPIELPVKSEPVEEVNIGCSNLLVERVDDTVSIDKEEIDYNDPFQYDPGSSGLGNEPDDNWQDYNFEDDDQTSTHLDPNMSADPSGYLHSRKLGYDYNKNIDSSLRNEISQMNHLQCLICGKLCKSKSYLLYHMRIHYGQKPYICRTCNFQCSAESSMVRHIKRKHNTTGENVPT